ncbi:hypothetical protein MMC07_009990 [Pseudocyphellaria aurata]|nr:hypothetical protein [Pseudocyphellaria aurata]
MPPNPKRPLYVEEKCSTDAPPRAKKRQKLENQQRRRLPNLFWDNLSRLWLTSQALREFDRRTERSIAPERLDRTGKEDIDLAKLKRFARQGGPSLIDLRHYPDSESADPSDGSMTSTQLGSRKKARTGDKSGVTTKRCRPTSPTFQQHLIDNGVYPNMYHGLVDHPMPHNFEEIMARLKPLQPSLSPGFTVEAYRDFYQKNQIAMTENAVMSTVLPIIAGSADVYSQQNLVFGNLENLTDGSITKAKPDCYDGTHPDNLKSQIRQDLGRYILPSTNTTAPCVPNFFIEAKGPTGNPTVCERQALHDGALGVRAIAKLRAYVDAETAYDTNAYVISATYTPTQGVLSLHAHHCAQSADPSRGYDYFMTQIDAYFMTKSLDEFRRGASTLRNARDWAKEKRHELVIAANRKGERTSSTSTLNSLSSDRTAHWETGTSSTDELAVDANTPSGGTSVRDRSEIPL